MNPNVARTVARVRHAACCGAALLGAWIFAGRAGADTIGYVPMQGGMVHVLIYFQDVPDEPFSVSFDTSDVPVLVPLAVSTNVTFNAADPWAAPLANAAFSRRYGLVMDGDSELLPDPNYAIWIRRVEFSPGLQAYNYSTLACNPILGTAGSSPVLTWNRVMYHPLFACAECTGSAYAVCEVFLADTRTGQPVPGYASARFTLNFGCIPLPRLAAIRSQPQGMELSWFAAAGRTYRVWYGTQPGGPWQPLAGPLPAPQQACTDAVTRAGAVFYRLSMDAGWPP